MVSPSRCYQLKNRNTAALISQDEEHLSPRKDQLVVVYPLENALRAHRVVIQQSVYVVALGTVAMTD